MMRSPFRCRRPSMRHVATLSLALAGAVSGCATHDIPPSNSSLPESLRTPPQEVLEDVLATVGETVYSCRRSAGQLTWMATGSEATLVDQARRNVGTIIPGPRFVAYDGSYLEGQVAAQELITTDSLPWQLIVARRKAGDARNEGRFADVTSVQQVRTHGGVPPQADCQQQGMSLLVPYSATYLVYRAANAKPLAEPAAPLTAPSPASAPAESGAPSAAAPRETLALAALSKSSGFGLPTFFDSVRP